MVVIDYGIGNVFSVCNALSHIGASPILSGDPSVVANAERVILPGVGAFSKAMENLRSQRLDAAIANFIDTGRPFLGICIGMQVLMESSSELGEHLGLGHIKGKVGRLQNLSDGTSKTKVPNIGWFRIVEKEHDEMISPLGAHFYFVHSYCCQPIDSDNLMAIVSAGGEIPAVIGKDNIIGVQFHPERSGPDGLRFLQSFLAK